jgi:hypothetical protein
MWQSIEAVAMPHHRYAMPEENAPIYHGRGLKKPLAEIWPRVKHWR